MSNSSRREEGSSSSKPRVSPFSPFPFGSPLQQGLDQSSFCGSPGQRYLLDSFSSSTKSRTAQDVVTPRLKGQDMYGGPVMFGGGSSFRRHRMLSSSPYSAALRTRQTERLARTGGGGGGGGMGVVPGSEPTPPSSLPSPASSPSPGPTPDTLSTTAKLILDTLDKMSTPIQDAKRMPTLIQPRAEKRKLIEEELNCSLKSPQRRRVRLGSSALSLGGPPLRKNYSPVPAPTSRPLTNGLSKSPLPSPTGLTTQQCIPSVPVSPPCVSLPTKSHLKARTKVSDSGRRKDPVMTSMSPPPSPPPCLNTATGLVVDTLPVFCLAAPTPVTNGVVTMVAETEEDILENNNNSKKRSLEDIPGSCSNKVTTAGRLEFESKSTAASSTMSPVVSCMSAPEWVVSPLPPTPSQPSPPPSTSPPLVLPPSSHIKPSPPPPTEAAPLPTEVSPTYSFASPVTVISEGSVVLAPGAVYTFCLPTTVWPYPRTTSTGSTASKAGRTVSTQGDRRLASPRPSLAQLPQHKMMFSSMPDVTNNLVKKSPVMKNCLKGSNSSSKLPDLTASTGFGGFAPAKELKIGSVMDILGKKA